MDPTGEDDEVEPPNDEAKGIDGEFHDQADNVKKSYELIVLINKIVQWAATPRMAGWVEATCKS
jgi:hypothetical protein